MSELNRKASEAMQTAGAHACTDITGFGLVGHAYEMAKASNAGITLYASRIPIIDKAVEYAERGFIPEGDYRNKEYCKKAIRISPEISPAISDIMFDAQTSGGLLISISQDKADEFLKLYPKANVVGEVTKNNQGMITIEF
jgi:selenide,water dikinase